jgi:CubicO group peptidase (beta-lactamase class C family)
LGTRSPKEAFGHDGWTGTFTLIDPVNNLTICILTNAIHTILYDHDSHGNLFFGKQYYFLYDGQKTFAGSRIGQVLCDLIYEAFNH